MILPAVIGVAALRDGDCSHSDMTESVPCRRLVFALQKVRLWPAVLVLTIVGAQAGVVLTSLHSFQVSPMGADPQAGLVLGSDGNLYGTTYLGGTHSGKGTVFQIRTNGALTSLYSFTGGNDGANPQAALVQGSDGYLYGSTSVGGTNNSGTVFKINTNGALISLHSFTGGNDGANPQAALVLGSDGNLYGVTEGGARRNQHGLGQGTVFKINTNGTLTSLHLFTGGNDGGNPGGGLVRGSDGNLYGTTYIGGTSNSGTVFKISTNGALMNLYSFTGGNDGANPQAALVQGADGNLYGTTQGGGTGNSGTVFQISTNGALTGLYSFSGGSDGGSPEAGLVQGSDGNLYGTTYGGGVSTPNGGNGTVFQISTNGVLTSLYSFSGGNDGANPLAALVQGGDGNLYGTTFIGGTNNHGVVFQISTNGTETSLYSFIGDNDGANPGAGLVQGSDGRFYGTTPYGGAGLEGTAFQISTNGALTSLHLFTGGNDGGFPQAGVIQGNDGNLYGTTGSGGTGSGGTVFEISTNGVLAILYSFTGGNDGANPQSALVQASDGNFYGTTVGGGTGNSGTVFQIGTNGTFNSLYSFTSAIDGANPTAGLVQGSDGDFYGTAPVGGPGGSGTVFRINTGGVLAVLHSFTGTTDGANPYVGLVQGNDGDFYGATGSGGANGGYGTVFKITAAGVLTTLHAFTGGIDGANPYGALVQNTDGNFIGTTYHGGTNTRRVVARFEAERQALALMDHPNIAKVLDAGTTCAGRPFFVMELVRGIRITDYCDQNALSTHDRLDLFVLVCQAIQHAHQKGIIHRDVKPSNIMVTLRDGVPVPKVIDFGIAKAITGQPLTDKTVFTAFEQFIGTPAYMSPEQAEMNEVGIDTRSDIYSLGVLLYELLTGQTPFDSKVLLQGGLDETRRIIREKVPARPSTRLSTMLAADLSVVANHRHTESLKLTSLIRGDLDWIVMKALEKDRTRRYETANGLAMDVRRYQDNEPVVAAPPSKLYFLQKLACRNKLAFIFGAVVVVLLILGLCSATMAVIRIKRDDQQIRQAKDDATEKLRASYVAEARAERHSGRAGQRFASLEAVRNAAAIRPDLEARDETIACLALSDLGVAKQAAFRSSIPDPQFRFDSNLEKYAIEEGQGNITIRAAVDDAELMLLPGFGVGVNWIGGFSPDGHFLAVTYSDDTVWVWNLTEPKPALRGLAGYRAGDFSPDSSVFALSTPDGDLVFHALLPGRQTRRLEVKRKFDLVVFDPKGTRLACAPWKEGILEIREVENGNVIFTCLATANATSVAWSSDGKFVAMGCADGLVHVRDAQSGQKVGTLQGHTEPVVSVAFNHAGDLLASASFDDSLRLWNPATGRQIVGFLGCNYGLHFSPDNLRLAAFQNGSSFGLLSVTRSAEYRRLSSPNHGPDHAGPDFSSDGRLVAAGTGDRVCFWDTISGKQVAYFQVGSCEAAFFAPDGRSFITAEITGLYSRSFHRLPGLAGSAYKLGPPHRLCESSDPREAALSLDGRHLALVANHIEGQSLILDLEDPAANVGLGKHPLVDYIAISPNGCWAATASYHDSIVKLWNAQSGKLVRTLSMPARSRVTFSPDGRWLGTSSTEYQLFEVGSWRPRSAPIPGHPIANLNALAFSPDSSVFAIVQDGRKIRLIETLTGRSLATLEAPDGGRIASLRFSPDGSKLAALEQNRQLQLWDLFLVRKALKQTSLDWDLPPYSPRDVSRIRADATLEIDPAAGLDPFASPELARTIPQRDPQASTNLIDLTEFYNSPLSPSADLKVAVNLYDLPRGVQNLAGVAFDVRGLLQLGEPTATGPKYPMKVSGIVLRRACQRLHFLHGAISVASAPKGTQIGSYMIHYTTGRLIEIPILASEALAGEITATAPPHKLSTVAWKSNSSGPYRSGDRICLVGTTWENPFPAELIASLDFLANRAGPAPFLVAITADP